MEIPREIIVLCGGLNILEIEEFFQLSVSYLKDVNDAFWFK
jgi:hypothetical protein